MTQDPPGVFATLILISHTRVLVFLWQQTPHIHNFEEYLEKFIRLLCILELLGYSGCKEL